MKDGLKNKFKKDSKGTAAPNGFTDYLDLTKIKSVKLEKLKLQTGKDYLLGIVPFKTKTDKCLTQSHPKKVYNEVGEQTFHMLVFVHSFLQFTTGSYICMQETYGKKCPICEYYERLKSDKVPWDDIKHLRPKLRGIYLIKDENDKLNVLDVSNNLFEKEWRPIVDKREKRGDDFFPVYVKDEWGRYIDFSVIDSGKGYYDLTAFDFPKITDFSEEIANHDIYLDEALVLPDVQAIQVLIENIGETLPDDQKEESDDNKSNTEQEYYNDVIDNEEQEEPNEPAQEPVKKKKKKEPDNECPYGLKFGVEWDEYQNCDTCQKEHPENYEKCKQASKGV